jgi:hypothetical protein
MTDAEALAQIAAVIASAKQFVAEAEAPPRMNRWARLQVHRTVLANVILTIEQLCQGTYAA